MKEVKKAEFGRICAVDTTVKKAKAICQAQALEALSGTYNPYFLQGKCGDDWLAWRDPVFGWSYTRLGSDTAGTLYGSDNCWGRDICIRRMRYHASQNAYQPWQSKAARDEALALAHVDDQVEMLEYYLWQDKYAVGKNHGWIDEECRYYADTNKCPETRRKTYHPNESGEDRGIE